MEVKKYLLVFVILFMTLSSLATINVPVKVAAQPTPYVKVYVDQPGGYIPGQPVDQRFTVDIIIEVSGINDTMIGGSPNGIVGWGLYVQVDPDVLNITRAKGATSGYFLWEFADYEWLPYPTIYSNVDGTTGFADVAEFIAPTPTGGAGDSYSGYKLITLEFISKSETAYSKIDLFGVEYQTPDGKWHAVDEVIDGHYNEYIPHDLTVESTPIDGINFTIDSTDYTTNTSVNLPEGNRTVTMPSAWMVGADQYNFVEWEDNSTNPVRTISLAGNTTITATYELYALEYPSIIIEPAFTDTTLAPGENFNISIKTDYTGTDIFSWGFTLTYNPLVLHGVNVTNGDLITKAKHATATFIPGTFDNTEGKLGNTAAGFFGDADPTDGVDVTYGPGTLANVTFSVVGYGKTNITFGRGPVETYLQVWNATPDPPTFPYGQPYLIIDAKTMPDHIQEGYFRNVQPIPVKVYVDQPGGYIPGQPVDQMFTVDIIIEVTNITDNSPEGIVGWGFYVQVDPDVLDITRAKGATSGYFLYEFADYEWLPYPVLYTFFNATEGFGDVSEFIAPTPAGGAGDSYSGYKLITLRFISKSETAYSKIDLFGVEYMDANEKWHAVDEVIDGSYNPPIYHNLTVGSTPIAGINFTIDSTTYTTNTSVNLLEASYTVSMPSAWMVGADQYNFVEWEDTSTNPVRVISLTANKTITATYELATQNYTLTVNSVPISGINFTIGAMTYMTNTSAISLLKGTYNVTMLSTWWNDTDQYNFLKWEDDSTNPVRTISLTANKTITATYGCVPEASFTFSPTEAIVGETVVFNASASEDPDGTIIGYSWAFGDGNIANDTGPITTHAYANAGNYTVTLYVYDNDYQPDSYTMNVIVTHLLAPVAFFTFSPTDPIVGETVVFNASASEDPDGTIVTYAWDFGDGTTSNTTEPGFEHAYNQTNTYTVVLTVTDNDGLTNTATMYVTVIHRMLHVELSGGFDYLLRESVRVKIVALVRDVTTMEPVSNANVSIQIYDDNDDLWVSSVMNDSPSGTGIYIWTSNGTIKELRLAKGVYLVRVEASFRDGPTAYDVLLFHIDPPADGTNEMPFYIALTAIVFATVTGLIFKRQRIAKIFRRLNRHI